MFTLVNKARITENKAKLLIKDVLEAVSALHSMCIIHWDIKPENLMFDHWEEVVKLIDFGLSC